MEYLAEKRKIRESYVKWSEEKKKESRCSYTDEPTTVNDFERHLPNKLYEENLSFASRNTEALSYEPGRKRAPCFNPDQACGRESVSKKTLD